MSGKNACGFEFQAETVEHNYESRWHTRDENNCFFSNNGNRDAGTDEGSILNTFVITKEQVTGSSLEGALELGATL